MSENEINKGKIYVAYITTLGIPELTYALAYVVDETSASGVKEVAQHTSSSIGWAKQDIRRVYNLEKYKELFPQGYEMIDLDEIKIHCRVGIDLCADLAIDEVRKAAGLKDQTPHREEKKELSERKTHAEIIAEMRYKAGVICPWQVNGGTCELCPLGHSPHGKDLGKYCSFHKLAHELEEAHKREVQNALDAGGFVEASRKNKQVGNAAKLREALKHIQDLAEIHIQDLADALDIDEPNAITILDTCRAALAAPPRNCDVYATVEEARKVWCGTPSRDWDYLCEWLYAPATEQEGGNDGNE